MFRNAARAAIEGLACWAALSLGAPEAGAAEPWLRATSTGTCSVTTEVLAERIREATLGTPDPDLQVEVAISGGVRTKALVRLSRDSRSIGTKQLEATTCGEAVDAVTAVVALALSSTSNSAGPLPASPVPPISGSASDSSALSEAPREAAFSPADGLFDLGRALRRWRLLLGVGADRGSLSDATFVVRAGAAARVGAGELRGVATYGVAHVREEVSDITRRERADFGAAAIDYCHGLEPARWVSVCAGLELLVRRHARAEQGPEQRRIEAERYEPSPSVLGGLALVYRDATVQPGLDLTAQRPLLGALADGPALGFRAAFGVALQF